MRRTLSNTTLLLLSLAACHPAGTTVSATNASVGEVGEKVAAAAANGDLVSPGRWEGSLTMHDMAMPGMPAAVRAQLADKLGAARPFASCVTPEQAKAKHGFFNGDKSCTYDHFTMGSGKIDAAMTCNRGGMKMAGTVTGEYGPDHYHMDMKTKSEGTSPVGAMSMAMTVDAKRVGACTGTEDKQ